MTGLFQKTSQGVRSSVEPQSAPRADALKDLVLPPLVSDHQDRYLPDRRLPREGAPFRVTDRFRPRVEFWKSIFHDYGEDDLVFHHRRHPWIVYSVRKVPVNDFASPADLDKARSAAAHEERTSIRARLSRLIHGVVETDEDALLLRQFAALPGDLKTNLQIAATSTKTVDNIRFQVGHRERLKEAVLRASDYLPQLEQIFLSAGLPRELTRIPIFESGFKFDITSSANAVGPWQFLRGTAKQNAKLIVTSHIDERLDPLASTVGAARYLRQIHSFFHPRLAKLQDASSSADADQWTHDIWGFVTTGWNSGPGRVLSGMLSMRSGDVSEVLEQMDTKNFGFASRNFYAELLALLELEREGKVAFTPPQSSAADVVDCATTQRVALSKVLMATNQSFEEFQTLNPGARHPEAILPAGYRFRLPQRAQQSVLLGAGIVTDREH